MDKIFPGHPGLSDEVNTAIAKSEILGGVWLKEVPAPCRIFVRTRNTRYVIDRLETADMIFGNEKYCPQPVKCRIHGSTWGGSMIKIGFIGIGMNLEFSTDDHPRAIVTSTIEAIEVIPNEKTEDR